MPEKFPYNLEKAEQEAEKTQGKFSDGEAKDYAENKNEFSGEMTQKELVVFAKTKYKKLFPDRDGSKDAKGGKEKYMYFPVFDYFSDSIIDPKLIYKLQKGGTLMSVGAGLAHLEEFLQKGFNLPRESITIADIEFTDEALKTDLSKIQFDMTEKWPEFKEKFDFILFLQSFGCADFKGERTGYINRFSDIVSEIKNKLQSVGYKKLDKNDKKLFFILAESDLGQINGRIETLRQAFFKLNDGGEIRFSGHLMTEDELLYVVIKLKDEYGELIEIEQRPFLKIKKNVSSKNS